MRVQKLKIFFSVYRSFLNNFLLILIIPTVVFIANGFLNFRIVNASSDNISQSNIITDIQVLNDEDVNNEEGLEGDVVGGEDQILSYTEITDDIIRDEIWSRENSPYVIKNPIIVKEGATLIIESGVVVKFDKFSALLVDGSIKTNGDLEDKVYFTSYLDDSILGDTNGDGDLTYPKVGDWEFIYIESLTGSSDFTNTVNKYSNRGTIVFDSPVSFSNFITDQKIILFNSDGVFNDIEASNISLNEESTASISNADLLNNLDHSNPIIMSSFNESVSDSYFTDDYLLENSSVYQTHQKLKYDYLTKDGGISSLNVTDHSLVYVENSNLRNISKISILVKDSNITVSNSYITGTDNSGTGVSVSGADSFLNISDSFINNINYGVIVENGSIGKIVNTEIICHDECLSLWSGNLEVINSKVSGAKNSGIFIDSYFDGSVNNLTLNGNKIFDNKYGIYFNYPANVSAVNNSIYNNNFGIFNDTENYVFEVEGCSDSMEDEGYCMRPKNVNFLSNYWGDKTGPYHNLVNIYGLGNQISNYVTYYPFLLEDPFLQKTKNPIILIPGITGTYLYENYGEHTEIWPNIEKMINPLDLSDSFLNNLSLNVNGTENSSFPVIAGDIIRGISIVHVFDKLIDELINNQEYIEGKDLFVFPYDWRFSTTKSANELKEKIDSVIVSTGYQKVDVIAHSMGGLIAKKYIADNGSNKIDQLIFLGTPQLGSPKAFKVLMFGDNMDYGSGMLLGLNPSKAKYISQNMPSVYELLPSNKYISLNGEYVYKQVTSTLGSVLNYNQTKNFMEDDGRNPFMFSFAENLHNDVDNLDLSGVKTYNFVGCASETIGKINISEEKSWIKNIFGKKIDYKIQYTDGDSTVPLVSADKTVGSEMYYVSGVSHGSLPASISVINWITSILGEHQIQFDDIVQDSDRYCGIKGDVLSVHSPVELHIYDEEENHVGPNENGDIEYGILGVSYDILDDVKYVFLPKGKNYKIIMKALDIGGFNLFVESQSGEEILNTHKWTLIPLRSGNSYGEIFIGPDYSSDEYVIKMDDDGDGHFDENYKEDFDGTSEAEKYTKISRHVVSGSILPIQNISTEITMIEKIIQKNFDKNIVKLSTLNNTEKIEDIIKPQEEKFSKQNSNYKAEVISVSNRINPTFTLIIFSILLIILLAKMFIKL